ncbi:hypothetical protein GQ42DRAFT_162328 [Ramicandelaber brevisporus]|nr:hypothetical protein GQ42DRAFT_162328 [Ramicandelaber brevisporus]
MAQTIQGDLSGQGTEITGEFMTEQGRTIRTTIQLQNPVNDSFEGPDAVLVSDNLYDLEGEFKLGRDSVINPGSLYLVLLNNSGVTATIRARVLPPLSSPFREAGTATFTIQ